MAEGGVWAECDAFFRKYNCRIMLSAGALLLSSIVAGLTWFVIEYRNQQLGIEAAKVIGESAQRALDAHTQVEREHYGDTMEILDELQKSTGVIQVQLGVLNCKLGDCGFGAVPSVRHYAETPSLARSGDSPP